MTPTNSDNRGAPDRRRRVLAAPVAFVLFAGLAACSDDDQSATSPGAAGETSSTTSATSSTAGSGQTSASTTAAAPPSSTTTAAPTTAAPPPDNPDLNAVAIALTRVAELAEPVALAWRPNDPMPGTLYIAERGGVVRALRPDGQVVAQPVLDMSSLTAAGGERGLLGLALSPEGTHLYVDYTDTEGNSAIDGYELDGAGNAVVASRHLVLAQSQPYANHNGGQLAFGPDGMLYIGFGDGGSSGDPQDNAQDLGTWLGKILRIDPTPGAPTPYTVPPDNPFVGRADAKGEIWSYGLRNPWRFSFDRATRDLWIADVGQNAIEEIDVARAAESGGQPGKGVNYGWVAFEGSTPYRPNVDAPGAVAPFHEYRHDDDLGGCSVSGGYVYRGSRIPVLQGGYVFADYCQPGIRAIPTAGTSQPTATALSDGPPTPVSFGEGPDGELYVLSLDGGVYRLDPPRDGAGH